MAESASVQYAGATSHNHDRPRVNPAGDPSGDGRVKIGERLWRVCGATGRQEQKPNGQPEDRESTACRIISPVHGQRLSFTDPAGNWYSRRAVWRSRGETSVIRGSGNMTSLERAEWGNPSE